MHKNNFIEDYLEYYKGTEVPTIFDRWACIAGIGAILERNCWVLHGHTKIYPNQYVMLVGESGSRKDTAINRISGMIKKAGYKTIAASRTSKEKLLMDMEEGLDKISDPNHQLDVRVQSGRKTKNPTLQALFPEMELSNDPSQCFIIAGELNAFLGHGNVEFIDLLTQLWDYDDIYESRIKTGRSVRVPFPTINVLGGNTNIGISQSFPTESIGQGFFSRLLMVYSDPSGRRITFPSGHNLDMYNSLVARVLKIRQEYRGEIVIEPSAKIALDEIYQQWKDLEDVRFKSYSTRRFTHLLKLCTICAASTGTQTISSDTVIYANTILHYSEHFMPKALGEFGKARNSDVTAKVLGIVEKKDGPTDIFKDIWPHVIRDLDSRKQLGEIIRGLCIAGKIDMVNGKVIPVKTKENFFFVNTKVELLREYQESQLKAALP